MLTTNTHLATETEAKPLYRTWRCASLGQIQSPSHRSALGCIRCVVRIISRESKSVSVCARVIYIFTYVCILRVCVCVSWSNFTEFHQPLLRLYLVRTYILVHTHADLEPDSSHQNTTSCISTSTHSSADPGTVRDERIRPMFTRPLSTSRH